MALLLALIWVLSVALPSPSLSLPRFSPPDNFLVNCGSPSDSLDQDNRLFLGDVKSFSPRFFDLVDENPVPGASGIYRTARAFSKPYKYVFPVRDGGTHALRLHFNRFHSHVIDRYDVEFHVLVDGFVVLSNFTGGHGATVKEFLIWVDEDEVVVHFLPSRRNKIGFINAIELISSPKDLILEVAQFVSDGKVVDFDGLNRQALEVVHRLNVGGPKITPFNDSLWRTWISDDEFLSSSMSETVYTTGRIQHQEGGASREVGPDNMYSSARVIRSTNESVLNVTMTWVFPIISGHDYLVRLHFCDIASISLGLIYFNVYLNRVLVYENLDLTRIVNEVLASPYYVDFVVDGDGLEKLNVSIGPSNYSLPHAVDGILNGIEVMKLNNSMGSVAGEVCAGVLLRSWPSGKIGVTVPLIALICLLLGISLVKRMRKSSAVPWTKLPTDGKEVFEKEAALQIAGDPLDVRGHDFDSDLDFDFAFGLQLQEAISASLATPAASSSSAGPSSLVTGIPDVSVGRGPFRVYCKGLAEEVEERGKTTIVGFGAAVCDESGDLIEVVKGGRVVHGGASRGEAEASAIIQGMYKAVELGLRSVVFYTDYHTLCQFVSHKWQPKQRKMVKLVNQVDFLSQKFKYFRLHLAARNDLMFAVKHARDAVSDQIGSPRGCEGGSGNNNPKETCAICLEDTVVADMFSIDECQHRYCLSCMKQHVEVKLLHGMVPKCPHEGCMFGLSVSSCSKFLTPKLMNIMAQRIKEASIPVSEKFYCPYPTCSALMSKKEIDSSNERVGARKCTVCHMLFCINCKVPWHSAMTCVEYKRMNPDPPLNDARLKSLAKSNLWRQCQKCSHMIELSEGCYHMTCRCGYEFCYNCGAEWKDKKATCNCPLWEEEYILNDEDDSDFFEDDDDYDEDEDDDYEDELYYDPNVGVFFLP